MYVLHADITLSEFADALRGAGDLHSQVLAKFPDRLGEFIHLLSDLFHLHLQVLSVEPHRDATSGADDILMRVGFKIEEPYARLLSALRARDFDWLVEHLNRLHREGLESIYHKAVHPSMG